MGRRGRVAAALAGALVAICGLSAPPALADRIVVQPGESIQDAINRAKPGDVILVSKGTYREHVFLQPNDDNLTLRGRGSTLLPPTQPTSNPCGDSGICLIGTNGNPLQNVRITGLNVRGFPGSGIVAFDTIDFRLDRANVHRNQLLGVFVSDSGISMSHTTASANGEGGVAIFGSPGGAARVARSRLRGNDGAGLLLTDPLGGRVERNVITRNCAGVIAADMNQGADTRLTITDNVVGRNTRACAAEGGRSAFSGLGVGLFGASNTAITRNTVIRNRPTGPTDHSGGIVIELGSGGVVPTNVAVSRNVALLNRPNDIEANPQAGVTTRRNRCRRSNRTGVCRRRR